MQSVGIDIVPIFSGDVVTQGIFIGMGSNSRISAGAGGKEHEHGVVAAGGVGSALVDVAEIRQILIKIMPAFAGTVGYNFDHIWIIFSGQLGLMGNIAVSSTNNSFDSGTLVTIGEIMFY